MKKIVLSILVCGLPFLLIGQGIAINSSNSQPDSSAMLDISSTEKGVLIPRMSKTEKLNIVDPVEGLTIYQVDQIKGYNVFSNGRWKAISSNTNDSSLIYGKTESNTTYLLNQAFEQVIDSSGIIYDSGGPNNDYGLFENYSIQLSDPSFNAIGLRITLDSTDFESNAQFTIDGIIVETDTTFLSQNMSPIIAMINVGSPAGGFKLIFEYIFEKQNEVICLDVPIATGWQFDPSRNAEYGGLNTKNNWISDSIGRHSVQYGLNTKSKGDYAVAFGREAKGEGLASVAMGSYTVAEGLASIALGADSRAIGDASFSAGAFTEASGNQGSTAIGHETIAAGDNGSTALGNYTFASGIEGSTALGNSSISSGDFGSVAIGNQAESSGSDGTVAIGNGSIASGFGGTIALGNYATANGSNGAIALGDQTIASGENGAIALGSGSIASGWWGSIAGGLNAEAKGSNGAIALGQGVIATGNNMMAVGLYNDTLVTTGSMANDRPLFVVGNGNSPTFRTNSFIVKKDGSINGGLFNTANSNGTTFGNYNVASHTGSIALGFDNEALNENSVAIGSSNYADGLDGSIALGSFSSATGSNGSIGAGFSSTANGNLGAIAMGFNTQSNADGCVSVGRYNSPNADIGESFQFSPVFQVGVGSDNNNRMNALEILRDGEVYLNQLGGQGEQSLYVNNSGKIVTKSTTVTKHHPIPFNQWVSTENEDIVISNARIGLYSATNSPVTSSLSAPIVIDQSCELNSFKIFYKLLNAQAVPNIEVKLWRANIGTGQITSVLSIDIDITQFGQNIIEVSNIGTDSYNPNQYMHYLEVKSDAGTLPFSDFFSIRGAVVTYTVEE